MHKIDENSTRGPHLGSLVKKALCGGAVLGLVLTMGATLAVAGGKNGAKFHEFTPVSRIAQMPVIRYLEGEKAGEINYKASYDRARDASVAVATYVARLKEAEMLGSDVIAGIDWKLGGTSEGCIATRSCTDHEIDEAVLMIPSPDFIEPNNPSSGVKKANVLDFCNKKYASLAMGVDPIIGSKDDDTGKYVVNGYSHAPALPCEVSIWLDDDKIIVDMLNPEAIFTLFFSDVLFSEEMQDKDFAKALSVMTLDVKKEIKAIIYEALTYSGYEHTVVDQEIGPVYENVGDIVSVVASSTYQSPYMHMSYTKKDGGVFTDGESKGIAQTIIDTLSTHEDAPGVHPTVINDEEDTLDSILSPNSSWRSARIEPISIPGKNHIIEACSPKYAKMAMGTGLSHVNALPCEITVNTIDGGEKLVVSYLDPDFMLKSLFADISNKEKKEFGDIPEIIMTDLQNIVKAALEINSDIEMNPGVQISYDMLPKDDNEDDD